MEESFDFNLGDLMRSRRDEMVVRIRQRGGTVSVNMYDELTPDETDLNTEFSALPGQIAYWATVVGKYDQLYGRMQREYDTWHADLYEQMFTLLEKETGRKPNISSVEYMVINRNREEYNRWQEELGQVKADLESIRSMVPALNVKSRCLQQLAQRQSMEFSSTDSYKVPKPGRSDPITDSSLEKTKNAFRKVRKGVSV